MFSSSISSKRHPIIYKFKVEFPNLYSIALYAIYSHTMHVDAQGNIKLRFKNESKVFTQGAFELTRSYTERFVQPRRFAPPNFLLANNIIDENDDILGAQDLVADIVSEKTFASIIETLSLKPNEVFLYFYIIDLINNFVKSTITESRILDDLVFRLYKIDNYGYHCLLRTDTNSEADMGLHDIILRLAQNKLVVRESLNLLDLLTRPSKLADCLRLGFPLTDWSATLRIKKKLNFAISHYPLFSPPRSAEIETKTDANDLGEKNEFADRPRVALFSFFYKSKCLSRSEDVNVVTALLNREPELSSNCDYRF